MFLADISVWAWVNIILILLVAYLLGMQLYTYISGKRVSTMLDNEEFKNDVVHLGTSLIKQGFLNKRIAVIGKNSYKWCVSYLAATIVGIVVPIDKELQPGTKVKIIGGPFTGMYGVIEEVDSANEKIVLNVDLFGQETQVEVELTQIEKA